MKLTPMTAPNPPLAARRTRRMSHQRGFALIVTLSLMILLTVIAVGLLALSSISLRSAGRGNAMAAARSNARMGLILALGDLQKYAGPDQRVTARADITGASIANPRLTGVWKSWEIKPDTTASDYEKGERDRRFLGWLASGPDSDAIGFAGTATDPDPKKSIKLWDKGTLGASAAAQDLVSARKVVTSPLRGAFAYAVMDEGVKARIDTPFLKQGGEPAEKTNLLGSGQRPDSTLIAGLDDLKDPLFEADSDAYQILVKGITRPTFSLAADSLATGTGDKLKPLYHDVSTASLGLLTDVAQGGLKEDFNLMTNGGNLPGVYTNKGVYQSRLGVSVPSDPRWETFQQFAQIYDNARILSSAGGVPYVKAGGPRNWVASTGSTSGGDTVGTLNPAPPPGLVLLPSIAKVQIVFSLLTRDIYKYPKVSDTTPKRPGTLAEEKSSANWVHGTWANSFAGSSYDYLLHLMYTPVVTLHNPYNVSIELTDVKIVFGNVPFALQVFRNGEAQTKGPAPLDLLYYQRSENGDQPKRFGMTLKTATGTGAPGSTRFKLLPGEVMMFSPYIDPRRTWEQENSAGGAGKLFSDWDTGSNGNTRTMTLNGTPGWRGDGIGFDLDWFCPSYQNLRNSTTESENGQSYNRGGCIGAKATDRFNVKFSPLSVEKLSKNRFTIEMFARSSSGGVVSSGAIELNYETLKGLEGTVADSSGTISYPKNNQTIGAMDMHSHSTTPISDIFTAKPFAVVSAQAKTTLGGLVPDGEDGRLATKPWSFSHAVAATSTLKIGSEGNANGSHEFSIRALANGTDNLLQFEPGTGRGNFITGLTGATGQKFGVMYDIPLAPLQTLASLNSANPGGLSGYLPRFAQPIGNSWAHPLLDSAKILTPGSGYTYADHSFLLNLALSDHFYFSGLANHDGPFGSGMNTGELLNRFTAGEPLTDPRLVLHQPDGRPVSELATVSNDADGYRQVAAWQAMRGAFNVNSTSVPAWKAMLGSIHSDGAVYNPSGRAAAASQPVPLSAPGKGKSRISRLRLPASESAANGGNIDEAYWLGAREYTGAQLEALAGNVVKQVRRRGPFLSMAEFVNRRLGSDDMAMKGALQQAIDETKLNEAPANAANAGYQIPANAVSTYNYRTPEAGTGPSYQGAPGYLTQADLMTVLGNSATARSDTFTIRSYGEARDAAGNITASATCEATVQRVPEYVDSADRAEVAPADLVSTANKSFGRRFEIVGFRWLSPSEI